MTGHFNPFTKTGNRQQGDLVSKFYKLQILRHVGISRHGIAVHLVDRDQVC